MAATTLVFVRGHHILGVGFQEFPHYCPGPDCAIKRWLEQKGERIYQIERQQ